MPTQNANRSLALSMAALVAGMVALSFASVPLYDLFCRMTGYGGKTGVAAAAPQQISARKMEIRFNADVSNELPWKFAAEEQSVTVHIGEERITSFLAENTSNEPVYGTAIYNVTPLIAAQYFSKIQCFCFENQRLEPGQKMHMPVSFFIDPAIEEDPFLKDLQTVTLSYTFFLSKDQNSGNRTN